LRTAFEEVIAWVTEQSGLNIPADQLEFEIYDNSRGRPNCQGKIAYRGPVSPTSIGGVFGASLHQGHFFAAWSQPSISGFSR
jgi:hypothetical protein